VTSLAASDTETAEIVPLRQPDHERSPVLLLERAGVSRRPPVRDAFLLKLKSGRHGQAYFCVPRFRESAWTVARPARSSQLCGEALLCCRVDADAE
jgi:hypothetical protein